MIPHSHVKREVFIEAYGSKVTFVMIIAHSVNGGPINPYFLEEYGSTIDFDFSLTKKQLSSSFP